MHFENPEEAAAHALAQGDYATAIAAADVAIEQLLQPGLSVERFIELSLLRAPAEGLLRYERAAVARWPQLSRPLALRWSALHVSGQKRDAQRMQALCMRHFPERASVWSSAGQHALDHGDFASADGYFAHCLTLAPDWTAAWAGRAIVAETRKAWDEALLYRARVVELEGSLTQQDPVSLQRTLRFAAALARVQRWSEAEVWFRRCAQLRAFELLPAERPVLLRVFSRECYAPAWIARFAASGQPNEASQPVRFALAEAHTLARLYESLQADTELEPHARARALGLCAWLAGDSARAYAQLDEAESKAPGDLLLQYLLACSAEQQASRELASVAAFACRDAGAAPGDVVAELILRRFDRGHELSALEPYPLFANADADRLTLLQELVLYRAVAVALGASAHDAARASADALRAIRL